MLKKIFIILTFIVVCCLLFSVMQAAINSVAGVAQEANEVSATDSATVTFPISNYKQDTYEDLNVKRPMDAVGVKFQVISVRFVRQRDGETTAQAGTLPTANVNLPQKTFFKELYIFPYPLDLIRK